MNNEGFHGQTYQQFDCKLPFQYRAWRVIIVHKFRVKASAEASGVTHMLNEMRTHLSGNHRTRPDHVIKNRSSRSDDWIITTYKSTYIRRFYLKKLKLGYFGQSQFSAKSKADHNLRNETSKVSGITFKNLNIFLNFKLLCTNTTKRIQYKVKSVLTKSIASLEELEHALFRSTERTNTSSPTSTL